MWIEQWPLTSEKLEAAQVLVKEQLEKGHLEPSTSPWNTPIFVIKKKSGKWRLLQDLRAVNKCMVPMGALQPGLPLPTAIPQNWPLLIVDLKDCFFTIPLHPRDREKFAFSLPSTNFKEPYQRYQWKCLPQGMANSPTLCQLYVAQPLSYIRSKYPSSYIIHYMDDILIACPHEKMLQDAFIDLQRQLELHNLQIAPEKIQKTFPYQYLGYTLKRDAVHPQKIQLRYSQLKTLNDFQKLLGDINWIRTSVGCPTEVLQPLYTILQGHADPTSPRQMTPEGLEALKQFEACLSAASLTYFDYTQEIGALVFHSSYLPTAVLWQDGCLLWIHLKTSSKRILQNYPSLVAKLLAKADLQSLTYYGKHLDYAITEYTKEQLHFLSNTHVDWIILRTSLQLELRFHYPPIKIIQFYRQHPFIFQNIVKNTPIEGALTIFTDGSASGIAAVLYDTQVYIVKESFSSAQQAEIAAFNHALSLFSQPLNIYTDSVYVSKVVYEIETTPYISPHSAIYSLLVDMKELITSRINPIFVSHIRSHTSLPGPLAEGNRIVDKATKVYTAMETATELHNKYHLNAQSLKYWTKCSLNEALSITTTCPFCAPFIHSPNFSVNPRGLLPNHVWQMDVTHVPEFGKLSFVHLSIDTFSGYIFASSHSGEKFKDVRAHCLAAFASLGIPKEFKTDNAPVYTSKKFASFLSHFNILHKTGIPYNPQGQSIVERANRTFKQYLQKIKRNEVLDHSSPHSYISYILYILNFLIVDKNGNSAAQRHWRSESTRYPSVLWKDLRDNSWKGPAPVLARIRNSVCVFPPEETAPIWVPERLVKPINNQPSYFTELQNDENPSEINNDIDGDKKDNRI